MIEVVGLLSPRWPIAAAATGPGPANNASGREPTGADVQRSAAAGARVVLMLAGVAALASVLMAAGFFDSFGNKY
jgi:hypothetical protein